MKTLRYIFLLPVLSFLFASTGCDTDPDDRPGTDPVGGVISVRSQSRLENERTDEPASAVTTKAADALTYTFEAWTRDAEPRCVLHRTETGTIADAAFEIVLVPGNYDFLFWADYGKGHYDAADLRQVTAATPYAPASVSERDAFACALRNVTWNGGNSMEATLARPVAKLTMRNTSLFTSGKAVSVTYRNAPTRYDVLTGTSSAPENITLSFPETTAGSDMVGEDFLFVPSDAGRPAGLEMTVGGAVKELDVLPLQPNFKTNITAKFED